MPGNGQSMYQNLKHFASGFKLSSKYGLQKHKDSFKCQLDEPGENGSLELERQIKQRHWRWQNNTFYVIGGSVTILSLNMRTHEYLINPQTYGDFQEKCKIIIPRIFHMSMIKH